LHCNPGGFRLLHGQAVDGVEQVVNRQMRLFVHRHLPMATAGRARAERAIADQCDADRAGRIIRILKRHTDRLVRARQQIAARINHKFRGSAFAFAV